MKVYAHRGARSLAPENTMAAFIKTLDFPVYGIELDIHRTKDGEIVICHDHTIDRTSNGSGKICDLTLSQLKQYDFGSWFDISFAGQTITALTEFLTWFKSTSLHLNIEIKNGPVQYPGIEGQISDCLNRFNLVDRVIVSSFHHPTLLAIKKINPLIKTGILFECRPLDPVRLAIDTGADFLHPHWHYLDSVWTTEAKAKGIGINTYTVNTISEYEFALQMGADAVITDFPNLFTC